MVGEVAIEEQQQQQAEENPKRRPLDDDRFVTDNGQDDPLVAKHTHYSRPSSASSNSSSFELLISDAGNGCIRRLKPNPFLVTQTTTTTNSSTMSPFNIISHLHPYLNGSDSPSSSSSSYDPGYIVDTIRAFVPVRCCHTSWLPKTSHDDRNNGKVVEESKESTGTPAAAGAATSNESTHGSSSHPSLTSLLSTLSRRDSREYITFQYPIGLALSIDRRITPATSTSFKRMVDRIHAHTDSTSTKPTTKAVSILSQEWKELQLPYGRVWTLETTSKVVGEDAHTANGDGPAAGDNHTIIVERQYAPNCNLIVVDARASCLYTLVLDAPPSSSSSSSCVGRVKRLAGSSDGQWGFVDGASSRARFCRPSGVAIDQRTNTIFIADAGNSCVRQLELGGGAAPTSSASSGVVGRVTTLAGHPHRVGCSDGPSRVATFYAPLAIGLIDCPFWPNEHPKVLIVAGGFRQGVRQIVRCNCQWRYETYEQQKQEKQTTRK